MEHDDICTRLDRLTDAVIALTDAINGKRSEAPRPDLTPIERAEDRVRPETLMDLARVLADYVRGNPRRRQKVASVLAEFGVQTISELPDNRVAEFMDRVREAAK